MSESPRLIHLVIERLKEEFPSDRIDSVYRTEAINKLVDGGSYDLYINHTFIGEVEDQSVNMWIPMAHTNPSTVPEKVSYQAADPKFFYHIVGTAKLIIQRYQDDADIGLHNAKFFGLENS